MRKERKSEGQEQTEEEVLGEEVEPQESNERKGEGEDVGDPQERKR